jgi:hypothetical protein
MHHLSEEYKKLTATEKLHIKSNISRSSKRMSSISLKLQKVNDDNASIDDDEAVDDDDDDDDAFGHDGDVIIDKGNE